MNKVTIFSLIFALALGAFAGCARNSGDVWNERPDPKKENRKAQKKQREHLRYVLSRVVLIRMNAKGQICIGEDDSVLLTPFEFASQLSQIGRETPGKPALFFFDQAAADAQPDVHSFIIHECRRAKLGHIYTEIPEKI